jgi:hypothetical protein
MDRRLAASSDPKTISAATSPVSGDLDAAGENPDQS